MTAIATGMYEFTQQLKEAQDRAKKAEALVRTLQIEKERLEQELRNARMERIGSVVGAPANDELILELQKQLAAAVNRNTQLELQMYEVNVSRTASVVNGGGVSAMGSTASQGSPSRKHLL